MISTKVPVLRFFIALLCMTVLCFPLFTLEAQTASSTAPEFPETLKMPKDIKYATPTNAIPANIFSNRIQARITNLSANMSTRMENMIMRFEQIIDRMEKRTEILKSIGADTSKAESELKVAKQSVAEAKAAIAGIDVKVRDTVSAANLGVAWSSLRTTYITTKSHLVAAHTALVTTTNLLKVAVNVTPTPPGSPSSTSTPSISTLPVTQ